MIRALIVGLVVCCSSVMVIAQPQPTLGGMSPVYLRQGEAREVALAGQNLKDAKDVVVSGPAGVTAQLLSKPKGLPAVKLSASADAALGDRELRVVTPFGVTRPLSVTVGTLGVVEEREPNNAFDAAQAVTLPACITGRVDVGGDADVFKFSAESGQHLIFDAHAQRLNSPLEAVLTVHDAGGRELPHADEYHAGDPMLVFDVPASGTYFLQVRDLRYRGGGDYAYRIEAGALSYVEAAVPMSGVVGDKVELTPIGHNLQGVGKLTLDLSSAVAGERGVRFAGPNGPTNEVAFLVTQRVATTQPTTKPAGLSLPGEVTGIVAKPQGENAHRFIVAQKQPVTLAITARRIGSPLDALLTLRTAKGDVIEQANGTGEAEARITRPLEPGEYVAAVRDLTYAGGPAYAYRLSLSSGPAPADFAVRMMPDAVRLSRGGHAKLWCDVTRLNGFKGPVTVTIDGAPAGVTTDGAVTLDEMSSGTFTLAAAADAPLGTWPLKAVAKSGAMTRTAAPELANRVVAQAYLTVTEPGPVTVDAPSAPKPEQAAELQKQIATLKQRLAKPDAKVDAAQAAWESKTLAELAKQGPGQTWVALEPTKLSTTASGTGLKASEDGSILATGPVPETDAYTVVATTGLKTVTAIRLEALSDDALPGRGPGRAKNGNFVLKLAVTAGPTADPAAAKPVMFKSASATFSQASFSPAAAVGIAPGTGWAIVPQTGTTQVATFVPSEPIQHDGGSVLTFTFQHPFGKQHVLGKFRLSVTSDPKAGADTQAPVVPPGIAALLKTPAGERTEAQKAKLAEFYRASVSPELMAVRQEIADVQARIDAKPLSVGRNKQITVPVPVLRAESFKGDVTVTLEGFSRGRDPATMQPAAVARNLQVTPLTMKPGEAVGKLIVKATGNAEAGTRLVVLRAEAKVGNDTWVQYSAAFPLTVTEK